MMVIFFGLAPILIAGERVNIDEVTVELIDRQYEVAYHFSMLHVKVSSIVTNKSRKIELVRRVYKTWPTDRFQEYDLFVTTTPINVGTKTIKTTDNFWEISRNINLKGVRIYGLTGDSYIEKLIPR